MFITSRSNLWLGWGLKQTCSSLWELSNNVLHSTYTHRDRVNSRLLVVESQTISLTPGPSFSHNLCYKCLNGLCKAISDIYTSIPFQRYKEHLNARCFDPCNCILSFQESWRIPKSRFRACEWRPHTSLKVGLRHKNWKIEHQGNQATSFKWLGYNYHYWKYRWDYHISIGIISYLVACQ